MVDVSTLANRRTSRLARRRLTLGILILTISPIVSAHDALQDIIAKYSSEFMGDAIARHTVFASSESNIEEIPDSQVAIKFRTSVRAKIHKRSEIRLPWRVRRNSP